jgi:site-specific recombinase XerD
MVLHDSNRIFDTLIGTRNNFGAMKTRFSVRKDVQVDGKCPVYLNINGNERRINLKLYVDPQLWLRVKKRLKEVNQEAIDINLMLDNHEAKITNIKTVYRLSEQPLTAEILEGEFLNKLSRVNFVAFFEAALENEKPKMVKGSYHRHESVLKKLRDYNPYVPFNELTLRWFDKYHAHLKYNLKNQDTTIAANMASIRKFLRIATKSGVKLLFDLEDFEVGDTKGNRTYLNEAELKVCFDFYNSSYINSSYKIILGYFLFSCMTGLRVSNIQQLNRQEFLNNDFSMVTAKSKTDKNMALNKSAQKIIANCEELFVKKFADQHLNDELKKIMKFIGITKHVTMHVGRHTFATLFLKMGGKVEMLQMLLGHSSIVQTMIYVHIVQAEANKEIFLLDNLLQC